MELRWDQHEQDLQLMQVERYLPEKVRSYIEQEYYAKVNSQAELDYVGRDKEFLKNPLRHVALYSDHGVVHVRDVARNILDVLDAIHGVLIPERGPLRLDFMKGYGVMVAYNHDIGMRDFSAFGRAMHPEFATQEVFATAYDEIVDVIWNENCGNVAWRLVNLADHGDLGEDPRLVLREMLAMAVGHSKSKVPIDVLNDPRTLRGVMLESTAVDLHHLYHEQQVRKAENKLAQAREEGADRAPLEKLEAALARTRAGQQEFLERGTPRTNEDIERHYEDFEAQAFAWIVSDQPDVRTLVADVSDTIRALRAADALRQRGTVYKTSGGYQVVVDQNTAKAIYALQKGSGELFLLEAANPNNAGEANVASSELTTHGDLRMSCARGAFSSREAVRRGAYYVAFVIDDIQRDIIETFRRPPGAGDTPKASSNIQILIENTDDNLEFAEIIQEELLKIDPGLERRTRVVPSLKNIADDERDRYLAAEEPEWSPERTGKILSRVAQSGHKVANIVPELAFVDVRIAGVREGEALITAGSPPAFVYVPMDEGLMSTPLGGYQSQAVRPWIPLGNTRVIRGDTQEATITAERELKLLVIPKEVYLKYWHDTYEASEFAEHIARAYTEDELKGLDEVFNILRQVALIDKVLEDAEVEFILSFLEPYGVEYSAAEVREKLLAGGASDFVSLRQSVLDYLALDPPYFQVARLRDLLNSLVRADDSMAAEEELILSELNGVLASYLDDETTHILYKVMIVPTSPEQHDGIRALLPVASKIDNPWGEAYLCGSCHSKEYADMLLERYRRLNFYAVIEQEEVEK